MAETACLIPEWRHVLVEIQQLAEYVYGRISAAPQRRRISRRSRSRQRPPFAERFIEDELNFALNPGDLRVQIGRQNARRIWVIGRCRHWNGFGPIVVGRPGIGYA